MSIYDKASLVLIPSGTKTSKVYSQKPVNGDGDFTFSRSTAATRVNADGLIEKETQNLLLQSNSFPTASWDVSSVTLTGSQSGYDGSSDAWKLESNVTNANIFQIISTSGVSTFSVYAKAGNASWIRLRYDNTSTTDVNLWCNLTDGSLGVDSGVSSYTENIGGGWYRIVVQANTNDLNNLRIYPATSNGGNSNAGDNIYIQDAQLNQGLIAQEVITTTTTALYGGITDNVPRLDYTDSSCPSLKLEPQRLNGLPYSEYFNVWTAINNLAITANSITSPEGLLNGSLMAASGVGAIARSVRQGSQSTNTDKKTMSVYAKSNASNYIQLYHSGEVQAYANFDLSSGEVGTSGTNATADIEPMGNDWYRCIVTFDSGANFGSSVYIGFATSASASYGGGSVADTSSVYIFGAQYEIGSYQTSLIPTYGTSVTRNADAASKTGISSLIGQTEGTMFMDVNLSARDSFTYFVLAPNLGSSSSYIGIGITTTAFSFEVLNSGVQVAYNYSNSSTGNFKIAFAYKANDFVAYVNGTQVMTDTSGSVPACSQIGLNHYDKDQPLLYKQALVFKTRLLNEELEALTTL